MRLPWLRGSVPALMLAVVGWSAGCATNPQPMVDPGFGARAYTPARVAILPPDVFVVVDRVGENDPAEGAALGQQVSAETLRAAEQALRARGYDVNLSARWDGIFAQDGTMLVSRDELGWLANGVVSFANSPQGGARGAMPQPLVVAPELAARVGWATQSDAVLYINVKGAVATPGKTAASVVAAALIVFIIIAVILMSTSNKGGHNNGGNAWHGGSPKPIGHRRAPADGTAHRRACPGPWRPARAPLAGAAVVVPGPCRRERRSTVVAAPGSASASASSYRSTARPTPTTGTSATKTRCSPATSSTWR